MHMHQGRKGRQDTIAILAISTAEKQQLKRQTISETTKNVDCAKERSGNT
jgi:hypothetical protein